MKIQYFDIEMNSGKILTKEKIKRITENILDEFANQELSTEEAKIILKKTKDLVGELAVIQRIT